METYRPTSEEKIFVQEHLRDDVSALALKLGRFPLLNAQRVLRQIAGYQALQRKVPTWASHTGLIFADSLPLEQCSSEQTAQYKAELVNALPGIRTVADLTGGLGVDFSFLAKGRPGSLYIERREDLSQVAAHNFDVLGLNGVAVKNGDGPQTLIDSGKKYDLVYLDPARRDAAGGKVVALPDCEPDVTLLRESLLRQARYVLIKVSPMLDIALAIRQLTAVLEVHVAAVDGECKELLFLLAAPEEMPAETDGQNPKICCVNLRSKAEKQVFEFFRNEEAALSPSTSVEVGQWLYEPNAALMKGGAFNAVACRFKLAKLHLSSHLYTSNQLITDFPGRVFAVEEVLPAQSKALKQALKGLGKANITTRNFPESVEQMRKKTGLKEGGEVYLFATTLSDESKVVIRCRKP